MLSYIKELLYTYAIFFHHITAKCSEVSVSLVFSERENIYKNDPLINSEFVDRVESTNRKLLLIICTMLSHVVKWRRKTLSEEKAQWKGKKPIMLFREPEVLRMHSWSRRTVHTPSFLVSIHARLRKSPTEYKITANKTLFLISQ